jgi:hypothetical protein
MKKKPTWQNVAAVLLLILGSTRILGYSFNNKVLQGLGAATGFAPFPKVFCDTDGYEAFTASFRLVGTKSDGSKETLELTPATYAKLEGPYMRRNVYGAALVFAPRLPEKLRDTLHEQALRPGAPLREEFGIGSDWDSATLSITDRDGKTFHYTIPCLQK